MKYCAQLLLRLDFSLLTWQGNFASLMAFSSAFCILHNTDACLRHEHLTCAELMVFSIRSTVVQSHTPQPSFPAKNAIASFDEIPLLSSLCHVLLAEEDGRKLIRLIYLCLKTAARWPFRPMLLCPSARNFPESCSSIALCVFSMSTYRSDM